MMNLQQLAQASELINGRQRIEALIAEFEGYSFPADATRPVDIGGIKFELNAAEWPLTKSTAVGLMRGKIAAIDGMLEALGVDTDD
jgi:hypothetical protein